LSPLSVILPLEPLACNWGLLVAAKPPFAPFTVVIKGEEEWEVEKILNKRKVRGKNKFLVW